MVTSILQDQQYMFGVKSLLVVESVVDEEEPGRHVVSTTDATIAAVNSLMPSNRSVMGCLHEFGRYAEQEVKVI